MGVWAWEFSCPYMVMLGPQTTVFHVCREHVLGMGSSLTELTGQDVGFIPPLFYCFGISHASTGEGDGTPTPVVLPGKSHGQRSLVGYSP